MNAQANSVILLITLLLAISGCTATLDMRPEATVDPVQAAVNLALTQTAEVMQYDPNATAAFEQTVQAALDATISAMNAPLMTATPTLDPTAEPSDEPPTDTPPTNTPTPTNTTAPADNPTPMPEAFPTVQSAEVQMAEQVFEGGRMFWVEPVNQIWVMVVTREGRGTWLIYEDNYDETTDIETDPSIIAPEGKIQPERGFGKLWRENPELRDTLGWALTPEFGYISRYRYVPGGEMVNGAYVAGPGYHVLFSLNGEAFRFNETDSSWQLGEN